MQAIQVPLMIVAITSAAVLKDAADRKRLGASTYQRLCVGLIGFAVFNCLASLTWNLVVGSFQIGSDLFARVAFLLMLSGYSCSLGEKA